MEPRRMRHAGLALAILWAGWWVFFASADTIIEHQSRSAIAFAVAMIVVMIGAAAMAWPWPGFGGKLLIVEGLASVVIWAPMWLRRFGIWEIVAMFAIMPIPPMAAGALLLWSRKPRTPMKTAHA